MTLLLSLILFSFFVYFFCLRQFRVASLWFACFCFFISTLALLNYVLINGVFDYQFFFIKFLLVNFFFFWSIDVIALWFVWLTALLWIVCILSLWNLKYKVNFLLVVLTVLNFILFNVFFVSDLFFFMCFSKHC